MKKIFLFLTCLIVQTGVYALQSDSVLIATLKKSRMAMTFKNAELKGRGAEFLIEEARKSHFVLIGEDHGIAELPEFTTALFKALGPVGYSNYATEIGPVTARILTEQLQSKPVNEVFESTFAVHPWSIPFFNWKEETEVLKVLKEQTQLKETNLWGLDQEFIISARLLLNRLVRIAPDDKAGNVAKSYYDKAMEGFQKAVKTKVPLVFLSSATPDDYKKLREAFSASAEGIEILDELQESQEIYAKIMMRGEGFQSNQQRADLMKKHFLSYYNASSEADPKVIVKLGANHVFKGYNSLGAMDIGNFVNEFAAMKGQRSFHIYVGAHKGRQNAYNLLSQSLDDKQKAFDNSQKTNGARFFEAASGETSLFDLRPLRTLLFNKRIKNIHPDLRKLIYSYDAFLVIPEATASEGYN